MSGMAIARAFFPGLAVVLGSIPGPAAAATGSPATNALILKNAAAKLAAECRAYGGKPGDMRAAISAADLTGDGLLEWFRNADDKGYRCDGARADSDMGMAYGQAGPPADIESGQPNGSSRQIFGDVVNGLTLDRTGGKPTVWVSVGGRYCGQPGVPMGIDVWTCELPLRWNAAARRLQIAPPGAARKFV